MSATSLPLLIAANGKHGTFNVATGVETDVPDLVARAQRGGGL